MEIKKEIIRGTAPHFFFSIEKLQLKEKRLYWEQFFE